MIITRTDYSLPSSDGIILKFDLVKINVFDFSKVDELVKMGYDSVMKHLNEIKSRIPRRVSKEEIAQRRKEFRSKFPDLKFQYINITGVDSLQKKYIKRSFQKDGKIFSLNSFRQSYFKLISNDKISEVIPHAVFNTTTGFFDLNLNVKAEEPLKIMFGCNISSYNTNQAYHGYVYTNMSDYAQTSSIDAQFGKIYNAFGFESRINIPCHTSSYLKGIFVMHSFDYFEGNSLIKLEKRIVNFNLNEKYSKISIGFPFTRTGRLEVGGGYGILTDIYTHISTIQATTGNDQSLFTIGNLFARIESNTLNNVIFPRKGFNTYLSFKLFSAEESFKPSKSSNTILKNKPDIWIQFHSRLDQYFPVSGNFIMGTYGELVYSSRKLLQNYFVTLMQSPSYQPTLFSRTIFNGAFCAGHFGAVGLKPVFIVSDQIHMRREGYLFIPYQSIYRAPDNTAYFSTLFSGIQIMTETALVYNFKLATAGLFVNYSSGHFNLGFNIGILLFNSKFTE